MQRLALVLMDGVGFDAAVSQCGYLEAAVEQQTARRWKMRACLPTISAALYETIHTGLAPLEHGITGNDALRPSAKPNVFSAIKRAGRTSAAVAHSYFHSLYGDSPFDPFAHCEIDDLDATIVHARYYSMDGSSSANPAVPSEIDLCAQAVRLAERHLPDYLLLHSSSVDTLGHVFGGGSAEYRKQVWRLDNALSQTIPRLQRLDYEIIVTADHGMNTDGHHGGNEPSIRDIPLYYFGDASGPERTDILDQCAIAPTILQRLQVGIPDTMRTEPLLR